MDCDAAFALHSNRGTPQRGVSPATDWLASALVEAVAWLEHGVLLVDGDARIHFASSRARQQLGAPELFIAERRLCGEAEGEIVDLRRLIARCARSHHFAAAAVQSCHVGGLLLQCVALAAPVPAGLGRNRRLVMVCIIDRAPAAAASAAQLRAEFGLTAAEAALACEVVKGDGLDQCAARLGVSKSTARTHLRRVFAKTGTRRQAQLVRVVLAARPAIRRVATSATVALDAPAA